MYQYFIAFFFVLKLIGELSEEAQEATNKVYGHIRNCHSRKSTRLATNTDLIHGLLVSSDPSISSLRKEPKKKKKKSSA